MQLHPDTVMILPARYWPEELRRVSLEKQSGDGTAIELFLSAQRTWPVPTRDLDHATCNTLSRGIPRFILKTALLLQSRLRSSASDEDHDRTADDADLGLIG